MKTTKVERQKRAWLKARDRLLPWLDEPLRSRIAAVDVDGEEADYAWQRTRGDEYVPGRSPNRGQDLLRVGGLYYEMLEACSTMPRSWDVSIEEWRLSRI